MRRFLTLAGAAVVAACTLPTDTLSSTIAGPIRIQVQNASYPQINNLYMNLLEAGGGDQHLYVGPVGAPTYNLALDNGAITRGKIHAVIGGEHSDIDDTDKMFMTERGDPLAIFQPTYACNPETDDVQVELVFTTKQGDTPGGWICVRPTYDNAYEFRYYPPGNTLNDPNKFCIRVALVAVPFSGTLPPDPTTTAAPTPTSSVPVATGTPPPPLSFTDMTAYGFSFLGCAPEERNVSPPDGAFRTLPVGYANDTMTNELCLDYCSRNGYVYAGTEYSRECWCGNTLASTRQPATTRASLKGCGSTCAGNLSEVCGGAAWLSLYKACDAGAECINVELS